ncbi:metallophosphoesterase [Candidatus Woesearchaeota archaeon]|nr:metallophosphoesterase [Candidatus Woesearchaeota archaeon]
MNRIIQAVIFITVFLSIYLGMHFYAFIRMGGLLDVKRGLTFYLVMLGFASSFVLISFLERAFQNFFTRTLYTAASIWMAALFWLCCSLLIYEVVRLLVKASPRTAGFAILGLVTAMIILSAINALFLVTKEVDIPMEGLKKEIRVVQLSDLHLGTLHGKEYLQRAVDRANDLKPDVVFITGDLADGTGLLNEETFKPLNDLKADAFYVIGNHDIYAGLEKVLPMISRTKVKVLRNELVEYKGLQVVGVDNPQREFTNKNNVLETLKIDKTKPSVLLYHLPHGLEEANKAGIKLQLSGHTHNGQIFPFNFFSRMANRWMKGLYNYKGTYLYVSQGTGTWGPPLRLGSNNEVTLIRLKPS